MVITTAVMREVMRMIAQHQEEEEERCLDVVQLSFPVVVVPASTMRGDVMVILTAVMPVMNKDVEVSCYIDCN